MDGPGGDGGDGHGGHDGAGHDGQGHDIGHNDGDHHSGSQNPDGIFDGVGDYDYDDQDYRYDSLPGDDHNSHGINFHDYYDRYHGDHLCDDASGISYYQDGFFHSGSSRFLDSYFYGGRLFSGMHLGNDSYRIARLLTSSYSHGYEVYPFGNILLPLAGELYRATKQSRADADTNSSREYDKEQDKLILEAIERAKSAPDRDYYGAHVAHGFIDVHEALKSLATNTGLSRVAPSASKLQQIEPVISDKGVSDWNRFVPPYSREETPLGYYPGATGLTYFTQQCWTSPAPKADNFWSSVFQSLDCTPSSQIEIRIVTWYYADIDDYETRLDIKVTQGRNFAANQAAASKLCNDMLTLLKGVKPTSFAEAKRCKIFAGNYLI